MKTKKNIIERIEVYPGSKEKDFWQIFLILCLSYTLCGCISTIRYEREYSGSPKRLQEIAIVTLRYDSLSGARISKIDGEIKNTDLAQLVEFSAGKHRLDVCFGKNNSLKSVNDLTIDLDAQPGHIYILYFVQYTHKPEWYPAIWDITSEISNPHYKHFVNKIDAILKKNRPSETLPSIATLATSDSTGQIAGLGSFVKGVHQKMYGNIKAWIGEDMDVTYEYFRYEPFVTALGTDSKGKIKKNSEGDLYIFHLQLNPVDGSIINVFGKDVWMEKNMVSGFQPLNSDLIFVYNTRFIDRLHPYMRTYKKMRDGTFLLISEQ